MPVDTTVTVTGGTATRSATVDLSAGIVPLVRINCGGAEVTDGTLNWESDTSGSPSQYLTQAGILRETDTGVKTEHADWPATWPGDEEDAVAHFFHNGFEESAQQLIYTISTLNQANTYTVRVGVCNFFSASVEHDIRINGTLLLDGATPALDVLRMYEFTNISPNGSGEIEIKNGLGNGDGQSWTLIEVIGPAGSLS
jgi:hypothetical protein